MRLLAGQSFSSDLISAIKKIGFRAFNDELI